VGSKPILFHVLDYVIDAGINDIGIVVSPDSDPCVKEAIGDDCRVKLE
jgi:glucose-1-phosphate thymidylyltransferase